MSLSITQLHQQLKSALLPVVSSPSQLMAEVGIFFEEILQLPPATLYASPETLVPEEKVVALQKLLHQRVVQRMPIQYVVQKASFYGRSFYVTPAVLIPRPETELLVEKALELIKVYGYCRVLDMGTGSGCIGLTLALECPGIVVTLSDISPEALAVAQENAQRLGLSLGGCKKIMWAQGDLWEPVQGQQFDLIVSNPPYIGREEKPTLAPEVVQHEPHLALFSPGKADAFYQRLAQEGPKFLTPHGRLLVEIGCLQGKTVSQHFQAANFHTVEVLQDYAQKDRLVLGCL